MTSLTTPAAPSGEDTSGNRLDAALREAMQIMAAYNPGLNPNACESAMRGLLLRVATPAPESPNVARQSHADRIDALACEVMADCGLSEFGNSRVYAKITARLYQWAAASQGAAQDVAAQATEQKDDYDAGPSMQELASGESRLGYTAPSADHDEKEEK